MQDEIIIATFGSEIEGKKFNSDRMPLTCLKGALSAEPMKKQEITFTISTRFSSV